MSQCSPKATTAVGDGSSLLRPGDVGIQTWDAIGTIAVGSIDIHLPNDRTTAVLRHFLDSRLGKEVWRSWGWEGSRQIKLHIVPIDLVDAATPIGKDSREVLPRDTG